MKYFFEDYGQGKPLVLLHAFPLSRKMWERQIVPLVDSGCRVILPDLKGFGENRSFSGGIISIEEMAFEIASLLRNLDVERAIIGGLSMGGYVTFNLFRLFPEIFSGILLFDTYSGADTDDKRKNRFDLISQIERNGNEALLENMLPNLVSDYTKIEQPEIFERIKKMFHEVNPQAATAALRGLAERLDHTNQLSRISVPALLIFGEQDKVTDTNLAKKMHSKISGSALSVIPNAGHYSNLENPEAFNRILVEFVKGVNI